MPQTIRARLRLIFGVLTLVVLAFAGFATHRLDQINEIGSEIGQRWLPRATIAGTMNTLSSDMRIAEIRHVLATDDDHRQRFEAEIAAMRQLYAERERQLEPLVLSEETRAVVERVRRLFAQYLVAGDRILALSRSGDRAGAMAEIDNSDAVFRSFSAELDRLVELTKEHSADAVAESDAIVATGRMVVTGAMPVVALVCLGALLLLERQVSRPLRAIADRMAVLPEGRLADFTIPERERLDEVGEVARAVAVTVDSVRTLSDDLRTLVEAMQAGSLATRLDPQRHRGDYASLVGGMNALVEGLSQPLHEVAEVMQRVAAGDLKGRMSGAYEGDLRVLKANLNRSLDALVGLLGEMTLVSQAMAEGDLTQAIEETYTGEFARLKSNINRTVEQLRDNLHTVAGNSAQTAAATSQTAAAARQVAQGAATQLDTLVGVAGAITETAAAVQEVSANAERSSALARSTEELARNGREELRRLAESIDRIATAQKRAEQIVTTIARMADKTHMLSLNAGIEAARAGDHGLGFGIVAHEIGRLAEDAAVAAREVERIIGDATAVVLGSVSAAADARSAIERMAEAAAESGGAVQAIAASIAEQSATVRQLSDQSERLKSVGQDNAAAAEQITASMEELSRIVSATDAVVRRFRLA